MKVYILLLLAFFIFACTGINDVKTIEVNKTISEPAKIEIIASNLEIPWSIDFLPNGDVIFTERPGRIRLIKNNKLLEKPLAEINIARVGEAGLLGIVVDSEFNSNSFIYVYYTYFDEKDEMLNRVSRFKLINNNEKAVDETINIDNIPGGRGDQGFHNGGRIKFGPDGKLYITTGDGGVTAFAQDINSLGGKILRINKDGTIPSDNPFNSPVYSYGHRNPQGLAWYNGKLFATEHGPTGNDELNLIEPGKNYGWPDLLCSQPTITHFTQPIVCFNPTIAPSGAASHKKDLYIAALRGTKVLKISLDDNGNIINQSVFLEGYGRMRDAVVHDNYLYLLTSNRDGRGTPKANDDLILRIRLE